jgi:hypothetical protein
MNLCSDDRMVLKTGMTLPESKWGHVAQTEHPETARYFSETLLFLWG